MAYTDKFSRPIDQNERLAGLLKDARSYSIFDLIVARAKNQSCYAVDLAAAFGEIALSRGAGGGSIWPVACLSRTISAGSAPGGGYTTGTEVHDTIAALREQSATLAAGVSYIDGLTGDISIARVSSELELTWRPETQSDSGQDITIGQGVFSPKRAVGTCYLSKTLLAQTTDKARAIVERELRGAVASAIDSAILSGAGGAEPLGILGTEGIKTFTFGGAATAAKLAEAEENLALEHASLVTASWIGSHGTRRKWRNIERAAGSGRFLWEDNNTTLGYRSIATDRLGSNQVVFGDWAQMFVAVWGISILVNPFTYAAQGLVEVTVELLADCGSPQAKAFIKSTDSAAQ